MKAEIIKRFWVITQKRDGRKFTTVNAREVDLCLKHPEFVHVAEVTVTEIVANRMYKKELTAIDMTAIEWSKADLF